MVCLAVPTLRSLCSRRLRNGSATRYGRKRATYQTESELRQYTGRSGADLKGSTVHQGIIRPQSPNLYDDRGNSHTVVESTPIEKVPLARPTAAHLRSNNDSDSVEDEVGGLGKMQDQNGKYRIGSGPRGIWVTSEVTVDRSDRCESWPLGN